MNPTRLFMTKPLFFNLSRRFSSNQGLVQTSYITQNGRERDYKIAVVKMNNPPVNSMSTPLLSDLNSALLDIADSGKADGLIIISALNKVFSAGLNFEELVDTDRDKLKIYWTLVQDFWYNLYSSHLPTLAAINGHCLGGGVIIIVAADYRMAAFPSTTYGIGVPATKMGLVAPRWFSKNIKETIGIRQAQLMFSRGKAFSPDEALSVGLIDEIGTDHQELLSCASGSLLPFMESHKYSRVKMKLRFREELIKDFETERDKDREDFVGFVLDPVVQDNLKRYIKTLKSNR